MFFILMYHHWSFHSLIFHFNWISLHFCKIRAFERMKASFTSHVLKLSDKKEARTFVLASQLSLDCRARRSG